MQSTAVKIIIVCCGCYILTGIGYVGGLLLDIPFSLTMAIVALLNAAWALLWIRISARLQQNTDDQKRSSSTGRIAIVLGTVTLVSCILIKEHGAYDAWMQWNCLAKYMSSEDSFRYLHLYQSIWHADYPPGLAAPIGLGWRLFTCDPEVLPRSISFLFYLCIPIVLCEVAANVSHRPRLWIGVLALFTLNYECVSQGLNQYADVPLALLLLLSFIIIREYQSSSARILLTILGVMLGGCMLMKNEGIMLASCVLLVYATSIIRWSTLPYLLMGIFPALMVLVLYKQFIPWPNDIINRPGIDMLRGFLEGDRYRVIAVYAVRFIGARFPIVLLFIIWAIFQLRGLTGYWKSKILLTLILGFSGFLFVYLTTRLGTHWLVPTTLNRVLMQLLPSGIYFLLVSLDRVNPSILRKQ